MSTRPASPSGTTNPAAPTKTAVVIYNPHSGRREIRRELERCRQLLCQFHYQARFIKTEYRGHAKEIVAGLKPVDLVLTMGGDGTFNEAVSGNLSREQPLLLSHIPVGTTNDLGALFCLGKNIGHNLRLILEGAPAKIDICSINGSPFVYVGGFGKLMNIPYETTREKKRRWGYLAYVGDILWDLWFRHTKMYDISFELNGTTYRQPCSFVMASNANQVAGLKHLHHDVKLNDRLFEVIFCRLSKKSDILRGLAAARLSDPTKVPGLQFYRTDRLKIHFHEPLEQSWCLDGERFDSEMQDYEIKPAWQMAMLLPQRAIAQNLLSEPDQPD